MHPQTTTAMVYCDCLDMSPNTDRLERTDASTMNEDEYAELGFSHDFHIFYVTDIYKRQ